jgi:hypothetical protein
MVTVVIKKRLQAEVARNNRIVPAKQTKLTDIERAKRIRETAREIGTDNDPKSLERAFDKVVRPKESARKPNPRRVGC